MNGFCTSFCTSFWATQILVAQNGAAQNGVGCPRSYYNCLHVHLHNYIMYILAYVLCGRGVLGYNQCMEDTMYAILCTMWFSTPSTIIWTCICRVYNFRSAVLIVLSTIAAEVGKTQRSQLTNSPTSHACTCTHIVTNVPSKIPQHSPKKFPTFLFPTRGPRSSVGCSCHRRQSCG